MARKNRHQAHENHERWLITYADLITLLLVFFIIMYAMSKIDVDKYAVLSQALNFQFQNSDSILQKGKGVAGQVGKTMSDVDKNKLNPEQDSTKTGVNSTMPKQFDKTTNNQFDKDKKEQSLQELLKQVQSYVQQNQLEMQVQAANTERGIAITLNDLLLFDLGKADLKPAAYPVLDKLAGFISTLNTKVSIEGHTDNLPLAPGNPLKDNWGLSNARSLSVLRYFIYNAKLDDKKLISTGYADTKPVAPNDSDADRQKKPPRRNRRPPQRILTLAKRRHTGDPV
ncbi:flagellar motor protein MotB [Gordoniibacillus kamchatkensis]|uniref:flagellar motor protein MotB n=1 Tax=Gordoniibacillus kamchatkensis TaxID=1590651 RepID=UPI000B0BC393|nr:flagellar motor protein MotB [Paenibacillus sp. VKM B-2647]